MTFRTRTALRTLALGLALVFVGSTMASADGTRFADRQAQKRVDALKQAQKAENARIDRGMQRLDRRTRGVVSGKSRRGNLAREMGNRTRTDRNLRKLGEKMRAKTPNTRTATRAVRTGKLSSKPRQVRFRLPDGQQVKPGQRRTTRSTATPRRPETRRVTTRSTASKHRPETRRTTTRSTAAARRPVTKAASPKGQPRKVTFKLPGGTKARPGVKTTSGSATTRRPVTKTTKSTASARRPVSKAGKGKGLAKGLGKGLAVGAAAAVVGVSVPDPISAATWTVDTLKDPKNAGKRFEKLGRDTVKEVGKGLKTITNPKQMAKNTGKLVEGTAKGVVDVVKRPDKALASVGKGVADTGKAIACIFGCKKK